MLVLDRPRELYESNHRLAVGYLPCKRYRRLSFIEIDRLGAADNKGITRLQLRCETCGERAYKQVCAYGGSAEGGLG